MLMIFLKEFSEEEYTKWLRAKEDGRDLKSDPIQEEGEEIQDNFKENVRPEEKYSGLDDELVLLMSSKRHRRPKNNLKFLTENDTRYKGSFSEKFREDKDIPRPFNEGKAPEHKAHSVMGMRASSGIDNVLFTDAKFILNFLSVSIYFKSIFSKNQFHYIGKNITETFMLFQIMEVQYFY